MIRKGNRVVLVSDGGADSVSMEVCNKDRGALELDY